MIEPKPRDIGRKVIYTPSGDYPDKVIEEGVISSINESYVFVRYGSTSAATRREDLEWSCRLASDT